MSRLELVDHYRDVEEYLQHSEKWPGEVAALRGILLQSGLGEAIKWGKPCYSADGAHIAIIQEMNAFCALMFFKGALLEDPANVLVAQGPNSRSAKRLEFTSVGQITSASSLISDYVADAIRVEAAGLQVGPAPEPEWGAELVERLASDDAFREGWESLTPGRRREYHLHISSAKKAETRASRIDKYAERIGAGKGMRDR